jgi:hypothetical protein
MLLIFLALFNGVNADGSLRRQFPLSNGWERLNGSTELALESIEFTIVVEQQNMQRIKEIALDSSNPHSLNFGNYLTNSEIKAITRPTARRMTAVTDWLDTQKCRYTIEAHNVLVETTVENAEVMLGTHFHTLINRRFKQSVVRCGDYSLPNEVHEHVSAIFGLHGLPLPPKPNSLQASTYIPPITPEVIIDAYNIAGVNVTRSERNRQAVAEFQGQYMNETDLATYFKRFVPDAEPGDEKVAKFVGSNQAGEGIEALLDIEFIMGVSPGIKTEFWAYQGMDFCGDLNNWTSALLATDSAPLVNSVSYAWQGNLTQLHCTDADVQAVDDNFAKLAAKGITILFASGDAGSGYTPPQCNASSGITGVEITDGNPRQGMPLQVPAQECCKICTDTLSDGWTWNAPAADGPATLAASQRQPHTASTHTASAATSPKLSSIDPPIDGDIWTFSFKSTIFHSAFVLPGGDFPAFDTYALNGDLDVDGGTVNVHNDNSSFVDTTIGFGGVYAPSKGAMETYRNTTMVIKGKRIVGRAVFIRRNLWRDNGGASSGASGGASGGASRSSSHDECVCVEIVWYKDVAHFAEDGFWAIGPNPAPPPPVGNCTVYTTVTSHGKAAKSSTISGGAAIDPAGAADPLWPSWPASSPWVTAVGATRFIGQKVGNEEMASDQFGSGGGFSFQFPQAPHATWQSAVVAKYLTTVGPSSLPPQGTFPPMGRATPDVSVLGEGYQVIVLGEPQSVGGTSASCPVFAGMVSLINEARFAVGKKQMGLLNHFIYANANAFTDITAGSDRVGRQGQQLAHGFNCTTDWDPVTGLGTPVFDKLLAAALALP